MRAHRHGGEFGAHALGVGGVERRSRRSRDGCLAHEEGHALDAAPPEGFMLGDAHTLGLELEGEAQGAQDGGGEGLLAHEQPVVEVHVKEAVPLPLSSGGAQSGAVKFAHCHVQVHEALPACQHARHVRGCAPDAGLLRGGHRVRCDGVQHHVGGEANIGHVGVVPYGYNVGAGAVQLVLWVAYECSLLHCQQSGGLGLCQAAETPVRPAHRQQHSSHYAVREAVHEVVQA
mmetsp:Transcript_33786/g.74398  ORF Transcript_33786/g.74398 Transcript_33786/m.74398 type:complete len:231 (-) Transcript_33786:1820-2512(-)